MSNKEISGNMELRFNHKGFFTQELNKLFSSKEDLVQYFLKFRKHYDQKNNALKSKQRMQGKKVNNYAKDHAYFNKINDHYSLLLTIGRNGFDIWLNDYAKN